MNTDQVTPPLGERGFRVPPPAAVAISTMGDDDLEQLRRALAHALGHVRLGSPPSTLLGRLSRQTRTEQRRRARQPVHSPEAA
ncbi:MAG: hypothetical protein LC777_22130 [Actinobacteria bacterium]|nr:hypothetical protein [Actinomycetota bacterium]